MTGDVWVYFKDKEVKTSRTYKALVFNLCYFEYVISYFLLLLIYSSLNWMFPSGPITTWRLLTLWIISSVDSRWGWSEAPPMLYSTKSRRHSSVVRLLRFLSATARSCSAFSRSSKCVLQIYLKSNTKLYCHHGSMPVCTTSGLRAISSPWTCYTWPLQQVKRYKKHLVSDGEFMQEFKLIELLTILQLITIRNNSDVFTSWQQYQPQARKRLLK